MENLGTNPPGLPEQPPGRMTAPNIKPEPKVKRAARRDSAPPATEGKAPKGERLYTITLHDNDQVPPGGQLVGYNGIQYLIPAGQRVKVPKAVLEVLDNAVQSTPVLDSAMRVTAYRSAPRLPYTLHPDD